MSLSEQVQSDLQQAIKRRDKARTSTLRLLRAALHNREITKGDVLDDSEALEVVMHAAKQRREAIDVARDHRRDDIIQREERELEILEEYLPPQLSVDELQRRIDVVVHELGATAPKDMGRVMGVLMSELQGQADGRTVSRLVRERLT